MTAISDQLRETIVRLAGNCCEYCRLPQRSQVATFPVDHIIPTTLGGRTELENLALACPRCNATKWTHIEASDPETNERVRLFHPRQQEWGSHFRWSTSDVTLLDPLTACGRATASLLDLNSPQRRQIRRWLTVIGLHPPP